jgi:putative mycofactocin binding protein MftB
VLGSNGRPAVLDSRWRVAPQVAVRPEPFGALVYHFGTRRLTFLKSRLLLDVISALGHHDSAQEACRAAGVSDRELPRYEQALTALADAGMIVPESGPGSGSESAPGGDS